jgi:hypothetical protein
MTMLALANWCDYIVRVTIGPSLETHERFAFQRRATIDCDAHEVIRRALLIEKSGHSHLVHDELSKLMLSFARSAAVELGVTNASA